MRLQFEVMGEQALDRELLRFETRFIRAKPALVKINQEIRADLAKQFKTEGGAMSGGWAPLKEETVRRKSALGLSTDILKATEDLYKSLINAADNHAVNIMTHDLMEIDTDLFYGAVHNKGYPPGNLPRRPITDFTPVMRRGYVKTLQRFIMTGKVATA